MSRIDEIRARVEAATKGPWFLSYPGTSVRAPNGNYLAEYTTGEDGGTEDAEFIAHAREDVPQLLSLLDRAVELLDECRIESHGAVHAGIAAFLDEVKR